jgi:AcrR family transcriptional regulator
MTTSSSQVRTSARTPRLPRDERRAQLLDVARDVFVASGYHAAAMDDIAEAAGISKPVLYQHFPSKLDLYLALLDQAIDSLNAELEAAVASTTDNKQRVSAATAAYFNFVNDRLGGFRLVFESDLTNEPAVRQRIDRATDRCARLISRVIAQDTGLTEGEATLLAAGMTGLLQTAARYWSRGETQVDRETATRLISALGWRGISSFPMSHPPE